MSLTIPDIQCVGCTLPVQFRSGNTSENFNMRTNADVIQTEFHDGQLLPMDSIAVCPVSVEDLAELVANVPVDLAAELARLAAWRALGRDAPPPSEFQA